MAIQWGGWSGELRVGIEVVTTGYDTYTPTIDVHVRTFVQCSPSFNFADNQTVTLSGSVGATYNFFNNLQANQIVQVGTYVIQGQGQNYGGGPDYYFEARLSGAFNGAAPSVGVNYRLPPRPQRPPAPPSHGPRPTSIGPTSVFLVWGVTTDDGGSVLIEDDMQVARVNNFDPANWVHAAIAPGSQRQVGGLAPGTQYWARARVRNGVGWSGWSEVTTFRTDAYGMSPPALKSSGPDEATFTWGEPAGAAPVHYYLQRSDNAEFTEGLAYLEGPWTREATFRGLNPGAVYFVRVRAGTATGWGAFSDPIRVETLSGAKVRRNGVWVDAPVFIKRGGQWVVAKVYRKSNGQWVV